MIYDQAIADSVTLLKGRFEKHFATRFVDDPLSNRNLIKRLGDGLDVARLFASPTLERIIKEIGIREPVYCGPIVTHYTSNDHTGQSYGLPFHQDWPSMASSDNGVIIWLSLTASGPDTHGLEVVPGGHREGLLKGTQGQGGYVLDQQIFERSEILCVEPGEMVVASPFLPHRTFVNPHFEGWKLSLSRRVDDMQCPSWPARGFGNAYTTTVDRELYKNWI